LVLLLGRATRLSQFMVTSDKEYLAQVRLGIVTDTYDADGRVLEEHPVPPLTPEQAETALASFRGPILQVPPMYSAVKVAGEPLYKAARRAEEIDRPAREVTVYRLVLEERKDDAWRLRIVCSSGTYIRTIAHELGQILGCGARLEQLRRVRSGPFRIESAVPLELLKGDWTAGFISMDQLLPEFPEVALDEDGTRRIVNGNPVPVPLTETLGQTDPVYVRLTHCGRLLAVGSAECGAVKPRVVLRPGLP
jgi:tRNA pseudouridine55 synthase